MEFPFARREKYFRIIIHKDNIKDASKKMYLDVLPIIEHRKPVCTE